MIDPRRPDFGAPPAGATRPKFGYAPRAAEPPAVSIITPFYNDGEEFFETERCVLGQSLQQFEWIIINDASCDPKALDILALFRDGKRDPRFRVVDQPENLGPGAARNRGVREARTEFVFQLDSDDLIEPTTLEKCLMFLRTHPACAMVKGYSVAFGAKQHTYEKAFHCRQEFLKRNCATITAMIRREAYLTVGGFDESIRGGMEDWDLWLRFAEAGYWGDTIPEYLDWYRRRACHSDQWEDWDGGDRQQAFAARIGEKYASLLKRGFPRTREPAVAPWTPIRRDPIWSNPLAPAARRAVLILPWMRMGGADKFYLDLVEQLTRRGWEVTIITTTGVQNGWLPQFARFTPDIFVLSTLVPEHDLAPALRGLLESRDPDVVMLSNSEAAYDELPYLRAACPRAAFVDYNHMEEEQWRSGGHPRAGVGAQPLLDLNITASTHLKNWMVRRGADAARVEVATINVDPQRWKPDAELRAQVRERLGIDRDIPVILYAGRICAQKQPEVFARTIAELAKGPDPFLALVAGDGEDRPMLERRLAEFGIADRVRMLGECSSDQMRELMPASDIFFLPSRWEGIALVLYEAMSTGAVVVGAVVGGQAELVTPDCGVLLPKAAPGREVEDEPPAYAKALRELLRDPARRRAMAAAARTRIEAGFGLEQMGERMESLFLRAITLARTAPRAIPGPAWALELADRAAEMRRLSRSADRLWGENKRLREQVAARVQAVKVAPAPAAAPSGAPGRAPTANGSARPAEAAPNGHSARNGSSLRPGTPSQPRAVAGSNGVHRNGTGHGPKRNGTARRNGKGRRTAPEVAPPLPDPEVAARAQLELIENSRAWRTISLLKRNPAYWAIARLRWGAGWRGQAFAESATFRLARLKASRSYRTIVRLKRTAIYRWYRSRKARGAALPPAPRPARAPQSVAPVLVETKSPVREPV